MDIFKYKNVLLIDDSYIDNLINRKILDNCNYAESITVIDTPNEAFKLIKETIENGDILPEVIFLDLRMPLMNGFEFLKALLELPGLKPGQIKIYVLTSSLDPKDIKKLRKTHWYPNSLGSH